MVKIGVTSCFFYPDPKRSYFPAKHLCYLERDMARYLYQYGAMPILIPDLEEDKLFSYLEGMDAIVLQGGSDLDPTNYNQVHLNKERWPGDNYRDQYELKIVDYAFKKGMPIFGICRGAQLLNTYFKGELYQDIPSLYESKTVHRDAALYDQVCHGVSFTKGGVFDGLYKDVKNPIINSVHHQGIKKLGKDLVTEAVSEDGIIEGFTYKNLNEKVVMGVQWHPEFSPTLSGKVIDHNILYKYFIDLVNRRKK